MLFKLIKGKNVFDLNEELKAIEEFLPLTERQMTYVILAHDYRSPFRKLTKEDRKFRAALEAGYKLEKDGKRIDTNGRNVITGKSQAVERAIRKYRILQKDEDYESLLGLKQLIADIRTLSGSSNKSLQELEKAVKMSLELPKLMKAKQELEELLQMRDEEITDIGSVDDSAAPATQTGDLSILAEINEEDALE